MKKNMSLKSSKNATIWFGRNPFGMFIHWGLYSLKERHEWCQLLEEIPRKDYELLADKFTGRNFDADEIAKLAKQAGMTYMCLTTKHHEGFCLFDSKLTDYTSAKRAAKRDFVAEYVSACRKAGLRVGLYYSLQDWHHPDWLALKKDDRAGHRRFLEYIHGQIRELCTNYGKIDMLFYDVPAPYEKPEEWKAVEMNAMVKNLQPGIIVNDRNRLPGDFSTPEQEIKPADKNRAWQTCMTLNENWGYSRNDRMWKSAPYVIMLLQRIVLNGGSLILNVGPKPDGSVPSQSRTILEKVGRWMKVNSESIYNSRRGFNVNCTCGGPTFVGERAYIHAYWWNSPELGIGGLKSKVRRVTCLATGKPVKFQQNGTRLRLLKLPAKPPDSVCTVFRIEVDGKLRVRKAGMFPASLTG